MEEKLMLKQDLDETVQRCLNACEERKAVDLLVFDVRGNSILADYYIVCSATSTPQIRAIAENLRRSMLEFGLRPRFDGVPGSHWVVLDYGNILIHILDPDMRIFYSLEELWDERKIVYRGAEKLAQRPSLKKPVPMNQQQDEE